MRKTLAFCILIAISIRTNAGIQAIYDSWKTSKISFNTSDTYFNDTKCFKVGDMLTLSCIEGYNMAGTLSSPERILVTNDYFKKYSEYYQSVKNYGSLILVKKISPIPAQTLRDSLALKQELRASLTAISKEIVESQKNIELAPFSFTQLIKDLRSSTPEHIPTQMIVGMAITGQLQTADPHAFLQPSSDASENTEKSVVGLGVLVHYTDAGYDIREVIPGGAANEAGLQRRDQIVSINGEKIDFTYKTEDIVSRFLGQEGTTVDLTLKRNGKIFSLTLKRKTFTFKNITSQMINTNKKKIGLISLFTFNDTNACASVKEHAKVLIQKGVQALILDLRNNLGGLVSEGECVGSFFTGKEMRSDALPEALDIFSVKQENKEFELNIPLVLIVNEASASATEMLAGGLQDYKRAWILGENTFGKGSMQDVRVFDADSEGGTHIAMTTGLIYRPTGRPTQGQGVNPDIIVPVKKGLSAEERWAPREFDLFPNAIQVKQTPWQEQRPEEAKQLSICAESANDNGDYQLSAALNVVDCL